jgi:hypothetical protein
VVRRPSKRKGGRKLANEVSWWAWSTYGRLRSEVIDWAKFTSLLGEVGANGVSRDREGVPCRQWLDTCSSTHAEHFFSADLAVVGTWTSLEVSDLDSAQSSPAREVVDRSWPLYKANRHTQIQLFGPTLSFPALPTA